MERADKLKAILAFVNGYEEFDGINIEEWIKAAENPFNQDWIKICRKEIDFLKSIGKRDRDSLFYNTLRDYEKIKNID